MRRVVRRLRSQWNALVGFFIYAAEKGKVMYLTSSFNRRMGRIGNSPRRAQSAIVPLVFTALQAFFPNAHAADSAASGVATMRYPSGAGASGVNFDLLAADGTFGDDCDPPLLASAASEMSGGDTILLAKLDGEKKSTRATRTKSAVAPAPAVTASVPSRVESRPVDPIWEIVVADKTLNAAMARWAAQAGWQLLWELPVDYAVEARTTVPGSFEEAVSTVAKSMEGAEIPMKAVFYQGNKVLRIMSKGSE